VLGIISTILGGGMLAIPFAIYFMGFAMSVCMGAFAAT
jgi:amino acid permease